MFSLDQINLKIGKAAIKLASDGIGQNTAVQKDLGIFLRMYYFLSQIVPYEDADLKKRYVFGKVLIPMIHARKRWSF
jgi:type I restriction enzyme R subunit